VLLGFLVFLLPAGVFWQRAELSRLPWFKGKGGRRGKGEKRREGGKPGPFIIWVYFWRTRISKKGRHLNDKHKVNIFVWAKGEKKKGKKREGATSCKFV